MTSSRKKARRLERKARREKEKAQIASQRPGETAPPQVDRPKRGWLVVVAAAVAIGGWSYFQDPAKPDAGGVAVPGEAPAIPAPPSADMTVPVRRMIREARAAVEQDPTSPRTWGQLGEVFDAHHLFDDAAICYREACRLSRGSAPDEFRWSYLLATVLNSAGGSGAEEIFALFARAMALEPDYPPGHVRQGDAFVRQGKNALARSAFERAIALDPDFAMAHRNLGQVLLADGEIEAAISHLEAAARYDTSDSVVHASLARAFRLNGQEARAQEAADKASSFAPVFGVPDPIRFSVEARAVDPLTLNDRIDERMGGGDIAGALGDLELLEESFPDDANVLERIGVMRFKAGSKDAALTTFERALKLDEHLHESHLLLAAIYDEKKNFDKALEHYSHVAEEDPKNASLHKRIAYLLLAQDKIELAVDSFERAFQHGLDDAELHHNWGAALDRIDRTEEAVGHFEKVLEVEPENGGTHFNLGMALERLGRNAKAIEHYDKAAALAPNLPAARRAAALRAGG